MNLNDCQFVNTLGQRELDLRESLSPVVVPSSDECVDMTNNNVIRLEHLPYAPNLQSLLLAGNKISKICPDIAQNIPNCVTLVLSDNEIHDLGAVVKALSNMQNLKYISLADNPICLQEHYRLRIIDSCPSVKYLDFKKVTRKEREEASQLFHSTAPNSKRQASGSPTIEKDREISLKKIRDAIKDANAQEKVGKLGVAFLS